MAEIQVRTVLQHAWAEIDHDIQYKSIVTIPTTLWRKFLALAGLFEIIDNEFQSIQNQDEELRTSAQRSVQAGRLDKVEITPQNLHVYLNKIIGPDGRITPERYDEAARLVRRLGFVDFAQIDKCIEGYDHRKLDRIAWGAPSGQITRFETLLVAGMGEEYILRRPMANDLSFSSRVRAQLLALERAGIKVGRRGPTA